jgi:hypothetical protein
MAEQLDPNEFARFKELLISIEELLILHATQIDAVTQLLVKKGVFTYEELSAQIEASADGIQE